MREQAQEPTGTHGDQPDHSVQGSIF